MLELATFTEAPWWTLLAGSLGSGVVVWVLGYIANRRLRPLQEKQAQLTAEKTAMDIVESALKVAQDRIAVLGGQVDALTAKIEELRTAVARSDEERKYAMAQLDLALSQRAELQSQLIELTRLVGERRVDHLLSSRPSDAIVIVDLRIDGKISYANDGVFGLLGYAPSELIGQPISLLVPEEARDRHLAARVAYDANPRQREMGSGIDLFARRRDGVHIPVDISLHPTGDGRVIALLKHRLKSDPPKAAAPATTEEPVSSPSAS